MLQLGCPNPGSSGGDLRDPLSQQHRTRIKAVDSKARSTGYQVPVMREIKDLVVSMVDLEGISSSIIKSSYPLTWPAATDLPMF